METIRTGPSYGTGRPAEDRYEFDFKLVPTGTWAQLDTASDAWYYGNWVNPFERVIISFREGDLVKTSCSTDEEFVKEVRRIAAWHEDEFKGIDPGFNAPMRMRLTELGLDDLVHISARNGGPR